MISDDRLAELLERWEAAAAADGRPPAPEEICRDTPDDLPAFRELLGRLGRAGLVSTADHPDGPPTAAGFRAGRFVAEAYHAAGGLGIVYRARDEELNRPVALKCLKSEAPADSPTGRRFLFEAEVTSRLEHPGVAPVHGRGTTADGRPFYAMRFIDGETLQDAARRFHDRADLPAGERNVEQRRLLRAFVVVCQTVAYAHSKGFIHRDLKPSNVMVGPFGEVLVMDWGLARPVADPDGEETGGARHETPDDDLPCPDSRSDLTVMGQAKGSPSFMSPEQARGDWGRVGPASDVYSLGSTLYYLLVGRVPYEGRGGSDLLAQVRAGRFTPPRAVRADVPAALDAVCRRAMAREPADRYPTARGLAEDVERWLADEPVSAWREPLPVRLRRRVKRHRTLVTATAAALAVGFVLLAVAGYRLDRKNAELLEANDREVGLRRLADDRFTLALDSTTHLVTDVQDKLIRSPATRAVRESILRDAMARLDRLVQSADQRQEADRAAFRARLQLGDLYRDVDQNPTRAAAEYARALADARRLREQYPDDPRATLDVIEALQRLGAAEAALGRFARSAERYAEAQLLLDSLGPAGDAPRARNHFQTGLLALETGATPRALGELRQARKLLGQQSDPESRFGLGEVWNALGEAAFRAGDYPQAVEYYTASVAHWTEMNAARPDDVTVRRKLALAHDGLARTHFELGDRAAAGAHVRALFAIAQRLADQDPENLETVRELALAHSQMALVAALRFAYPAAEAHHGQAARLIEQAGRTDPDRLTARRDQAIALSKLAQVARWRQQYTEAARRLREAIDIARDVGERSPDAVLVRADRATWLTELGRLHLLFLPDKEAGRAALAASRAEWERLVETDPTNRAWRAAAIETCRLLGNAERTVAKAFDRAAEAYAAGLALAGDDPDTPALRRAAGRLRIDLARLAAERDRPSAAATAAAAEVAALNRLKPDRVVLELLERNHALLADLYRRTDPARSADHTRRAAEAARAGMGLDPDHPEFRQALQIHLSWLGNQRMDDDPAAALALFEEALAHTPRLPPDLAETSMLRSRRAAIETRAGDCLEMLNRPKDAARHYETALDLHLKVVPAEPNQAAARAALVYDHRRLAELKMWLLDFPGSVAEYEQANAEIDRLKKAGLPVELPGQNSARAVAMNLPFVKSLPAGIETLDAAVRQPAAVRLDALRLRVAWLVARGQVAEAATTAAAMAREKSVGGDAQARAAVEFARLAARPDGERYADRAIELLRQAKAAGYFRDPGAGPWLRWEPLFEPLRKRPAFQDLVRQTDRGGPAK